MTLGMAKKKEQKQKNQIHCLNRKELQKNSTSMCDAFDMINRGKMYELGSNV